MTDVVIAGLTRNPLEEGMPDVQKDEGPEIRKGPPVVGGPFHL